MDSSKYQERQSINSPPLQQVGVRNQPFLPLNQSNFHQQFYANIPPPQENQNTGNGDISGSDQQIQGGNSTNKFPTISGNGNNLQDKLKRFYQAKPHMPTYELDTIPDDFNYDEIENPTLD